MCHDCRVRDLILVKGSGVLISVTRSAGSQIKDNGPSFKEFSHAAAPNCSEDTFTALMYVWVEVFKELGQVKATDLSNALGMQNTYTFMDIFNAIVSRFSTALMCDLVCL